ncbi:uncharacterized protein DS421_9g260830 [Arachis hypogaea]|nr:uncharacterized protein DS421_9g260830 [Arachis hypogaea]
MDDSTSDCQLNQGEVDYEFESNEVPEPLSAVDDQFVPKVGMTFTTLEDVEKFYRNYAKAAEMLKQHKKLSRDAHGRVMNYQFRVPAAADNSLGV